MYGAPDNTCPKIIYFYVRVGQIGSVFDEWHTIFVYLGEIKKKFLYIGTHIQFTKHMHKFECEYLMDCVVHYQCIGCKKNKDVTKQNCA